MNRWGAGTGAEWPGHCRPQRYNAGNPSRRWRARGRSAANCSNQRGCPQTVFTGAGLPGQVGPNAHVRLADRDAAAERQTSGEEHALQVLLSTGRAQAQGPATLLSVASVSSETSVSKTVLTRSIRNPRLPPRVPPPRPSTPPLPSHGPGAPAFALLPWRNLRSRGSGSRGRESGRDAQDLFDERSVEDSIVGAGRVFVLSGVQEEDGSRAGTRSTGPPSPRISPRSPAPPRPPPSDLRSSAPPC